jgi:hypothetical protein
MQLWTRVANELATRCRTSATLDIKYVERRVKHEGISFLTITLPTFGKSLERGLDQGYVDRNLFMGFPWQAGLPRFLGGFLDHVFDRQSGVLLDNPTVVAIQAIRQLTLMYGKILIECSDARVRDAMRGYIQCDQEVQISDSTITDSQRAAFSRVSRLLYGEVFEILDSNVFDRTLLPKHGPGVTADRILGNQKYLQHTWPARLEAYFPYGEYAVANSHYAESTQVAFLEPGQEFPARVIPVPKTLKTPRIIAAEPVALQYVQQAVADNLWSAMRRDDNLRQMIGHREQETNQVLARKGSMDGSLATLDLSEASDRVSNQHVQLMTDDFPYLQGAINSCRSWKADVLGEVIYLNKFASMGSALCFPVEAMVFLTMIFVGIEEVLSTPLTKEMVSHFRGKVRVYGDDIIVPVDLVHTVIRTLESFGIRVNSAKSFWTGRFRESCGKEYFAGHDVSITRVRRMFPSSRQDVPELVSLISLRNQLYADYLWDTCDWLDSQIEKLIKHFPVVGPNSPVLGRISYTESFTTQRVDPELHKPLVKGYVVRARSPRDKLQDEYALTKCLLQLEWRNREDPVDIKSRDLEAFLDKLEVGGLPAADDEHLERAGRPQYVSIKLKWASPV